MRVRDREREREREREDLIIENRKMGLDALTSKRPNHALNKKNVKLTTLLVLKTKNKYFNYEKHIYAFNINNVVNFYIIWVRDFPT